VDTRIWMVGALLLVGAAVPFALRRRRVAPIWIVVAALILGTATALVARRSENLVELTAGRLAAARAIWDKTGMRDYDLEVQVLADRLEEGRFEIQVRDGNVTRAIRNGIAASGQGDAYSIAGLFRILERELELSQNASQGFGAPAGYRAYLHARFNAELGYPEAYRRSVGGTSNAIEIRVLRLSPAP